MLTESKSKEETAPNTFKKGTAPEETIAPSQTIPEPSKEREKERAKARARAREKTTKEREEKIKAKGKTKARAKAKTMDKRAEMLRSLDQVRLSPRALLAELRLQA